MPTTKTKAFYTTVELAKRWSVSETSMRRVIDRVLPNLERAGLVRLVPIEALPALYDALRQGGYLKEAASA